MWFLRCYPTFLMKHCLFGVEGDSSARLAGQGGRDLPRAGIGYKACLLTWLVGFYGAHCGPRTCGTSIALTELFPHPRHWT